MRERVTFLIDPKLQLDPNHAFQLSSKEFEISNLKAAREDRITFGFHELPQEVRLFRAPTSLSDAAWY